MWARGDLPPSPNSWRRLPNESAPLLAGLTVGPIPPNPIGIQYPDIVITWTGPPGAIQELEHSADLATWQMIGPQFTIPAPPASQIQNYTHSGAANTYTRNFYRIRNL